ncbi:MAG: IS5 family transposase, partial [Paracoccaceae bacterium]
AIKEAAPNAQDFTKKNGARNRPLSDENKAKNTTKSKVRAKVERPFSIIKRRFGFNKVRYKGIYKNAHHFFVSCALSNVGSAI